MWMYKFSIQDILLGFRYFPNACLHKTWMIWKFEVSEKVNVMSQKEWNHKARNTFLLMGLFLRNLLFLSVSFFPPFYPGNTSLRRLNELVFLRKIFIEVKVWKAVWTTEKINLTLMCFILICKNMVAYLVA